MGIPVFGSQRMLPVRRLITIALSHSVHNRAVNLEGQKQSVSPVCCDLSSWLLWLLSGDPEIPVLRNNTALK